MEQNGPKLSKNGPNKLKFVPSSFVTFRKTFEKMKIGRFLANKNSNFWILGPNFLFHDRVYLINTYLLGTPCFMAIFQRSENK